jgi:hypothetical protein
MRGHRLQDAPPQAPRRLHLPLRRMPSAVLLRIRMLCYLPFLPVASECQGGFELLLVRLSFPSLTFPLFTHLFSPFSALRGSAFWSRSFGGDLSLHLFSGSNFYLCFQWLEYQPLLTGKKETDGIRPHPKLLFLPLLRYTSNPLHARKRRRFRKRWMH